MTLSRQQIEETALLPCPFCGGRMQRRDALWPSEGDTDAIIHAEPTDCPIEGAFSIGTADDCVSVAAAWNRRAPLVLQALDAGQPVAPAGWKLVPIEPTDEMVQAGEDELNTHLGAGSVIARDPLFCYRAMLAASPSVPADKAEPVASERGPETEAELKRDGHFLVLDWWRLGLHLTARIYEPQFMPTSAALADVLALAVEMRPSLAEPAASPSVPADKGEPTDADTIAHLVNEREPASSPEAMAVLDKLRAAMKPRQNTVVLSKRTAEDLTDALLDTAIRAEAAESHASKAEAEAAELTRKLHHAINAKLTAEEELAEANELLGRAAVNMPERMRTAGKLPENIAAIRAEAATLREALERSVLALDDWVSTHAPEECSEVRVANARSRIGPIGTLAYIAAVQEQNREALARARTQQHGAKE
jgi:hypothetical protein